MFSKKGFTLIELLIVVAIIAILAAIAVPNFLEAQTRSKVSRAKSDMRAAATALESFRVDNDWYPPDGRWQATVVSAAIKNYVTSKTGFPPPPEPVLPGETNYWLLSHVQFLTTPIAYMISLPFDPFAEPQGSFDGNYIYENFENQYREQELAGIITPPNLLAIWGNSYWPIDGKEGPLWGIMSIGPDKEKSVGADSSIPYDPTNGTVSFGNIHRTGP